MKESINVFGEPLIECSSIPLTGFFRNGCCDTDDDDVGSHTVCTIVTKEFLDYSASVGNDLSTSIIEFMNIHYGFINISSALAADYVLFNSEYHLESFLSGAKSNPAFSPLSIVKSNSISFRCSCQ